MMLAMATTPTPSAVGKRVEAARLTRGLTIVQLAEVCGCNPGAIRHYEAGRSIPGGALLYQLAVALGVSADHILGVPTARGAR